MKVKKNYRTKISMNINYAYIKLMEFKTFFENMIKNSKTSVPINLGDKIVILGNGPSQEIYWKHKNEFEKYDLLCVNFFPLKCRELFFEAKPKYICLSDPLFFGIYKGLEERYQTCRNDIEQLWKIINSVNWNCKLICMNYFKIPQLSENVSVIKLTSAGHFFLNFKDSYKLYLKNIIKPSINGVVGDAIYFSLVFGYKKIELFGADSNTFWNIRVDENNDVITLDKHNYGSKEYKLKEFNGKGIHEEFLSQYVYFKSFYELNILANHIESKITNYCVDSFIDAFEKQKLGGTYNDKK